MKARYQHISIKSQIRSQQASWPVVCFKGNMQAGLNDDNWI